MNTRPFDQRLAHVLVRPLVPTAVRPNHITTLTLALGLAAALLFAAGTSSAANWGAALFVLARFLDHFDGELARLQGTASDFGARYDYVAGGVSYAALFVGIGIGLAQGDLALAAVAWTALGVAGGALNTVVRMNFEPEDGPKPRDYPGFAGFELEDGIYLLAPITWFGGLAVFFVLAALGAAAYACWTVWQFRTPLRAAARRGPGADRGV